jgi:hypothetical protein
MSVERLQVWLQLVVAGLTLWVLYEQHRLNRRELEREWRR